MPRLILIYASMGRSADGRFVKSWQQEPLAIGVLAALTPPPWEVTFFDDRVEKIDYELAADLVGISIESYSARRGYQIAAAFRKRGIPVIMGGYHATLWPEETASHCDAICVGEAEGIWPAILADTLAGTLQKRYAAAAVSPLENIAVDRALFRGKGYMPLSLIETGRGCSFSCDFCSVSAFHHATYRRRSVSDIARELATIPAKHLLFVDDNLTGDQESARELFAAVKPYRKKWISQTSVAGLQDKSFVAAMAASGCIAVLIGFESLQPDNLCAMKKSVNKGGEFSAILANLREAGILVYGTFMFGYPHDTPALYEETVRFAIAEKMFIAAFNHLVPFPGTPLYARLAAAGALRYERWWLSGDYHFGEVPFNPEGLTATEVEKSCLRAKRSFYSFGSMLRRALDLKSNCSSPGRLLFYANINALLRREVGEKGRVQLGFREDD